MAIPTANLVFNDLNFRLALPELEFIVNDSGGDACCSPTRGTGRPPPPCSTAADCLEQLVWMERRAGARRRGDVGRALRGARPWTRPADLDADCVAGITYTGGTTGLPKGVDADPRQPDGQRQAPAVGQPAVRDDRFLHLTPMFHSAGVANMYAQTLVGGTQVICPGFEPDLVGRMIERYRDHGLRARADDDQHVPEPSRHRRARPVVVAAVPLRRLADAGGAAAAGADRAAVRLLAGLRHDRDVARTSPSSRHSTTGSAMTGDPDALRRLASCRHAVHRRRRRDPPARRRPLRDRRDRRDHRFAART